ncbi:MAG: hypothetical protein M3Z10_09245, partial [Gemmatimonadota bacterium]|nr:hypothetical protein [Gemmatimonadota bacterium]
SSVYRSRHLSLLSGQKRKSPGPREEDRGRAAVFRRVVDYARVRGRPSVSPDGKAVVIDIDMGIRDKRIGGRTLERCVDDAARADTKNARRAAGRSRFSNYLTWLQ